MMNAKVEDTDKKEGRQVNSSDERSNDLWLQYFTVVDKAIHWE